MTLDGQIPRIIGITPFDPVNFASQHTRNEALDREVNLLSFNELESQYLSKDLSLLVRLLRLNLFARENGSVERTVSTLNEHIEPTTNVVDVMKFISYQGIVGLPVEGYIGLNKDSLNFVASALAYKDRIQWDNERRIREAKKIHDLLDGFGDGIGHIFWKGPDSYNHHCGYEELDIARSSGDLDIFIDKLDIFDNKNNLNPKFRQYLIEHNYHITSQSDSEMVLEIEEEKQGRTVLRKVAELRWQILDEDYTNIPGFDFMDLYRRSEITAEGFNVLGVTDQFLTTSLHGLKHGFERLKWVADVSSMIAHHGDRIDWDQLMKYGVDNQLLVPMLLAPVLANTFFGVPLPNRIRVILALNEDLRGIMNELVIMTASNINNIDAGGRPHDKYIRATQVTINRGFLKTIRDSLTVPECDKATYPNGKGVYAKSRRYIVGNKNRVERIMKREGGLGKALMFVVSRFISYKG